MQIRIIKITFRIIAILLTQSFTIINKNVVDSKKLYCEKIELVCGYIPLNLKNKIINSQKEYNELIKSTSTSSMYKDYIPPAIDFKKYTLIGNITSIAGCQNPSAEYDLTTDFNGGPVSFNLTLTQSGICKKLNYHIIWCLIDKVDNPNKITFNIIKKIVE